MIESAAVASRPDVLGVGQVPGAAPNAQPPLPALAAIDFANVLVAFPGALGDVEPGPPAGEGEGAHGDKDAAGGRTAPGVADAEPGAVPGATAALWVVVPPADPVAAPGAAAPAPGSVPAPPAARPIVPAAPAVGPTSLVAPGGPDATTPAAATPRPASGELPEAAPGNAPAPPPDPWEPVGARLDLAARRPAGEAAGEVIEAAGESPAAPAPMRAHVTDAEPARSGEAEPAPSGETEPARSGEAEPAPSGETEPTRSGQVDRPRSGEAGPRRSASVEVVRAAPVETAPVPGERELGRRETAGGMVEAGSRGVGHGETPQARSGGGVGPSAPSSLSPTPGRPAPEAPAAAGANGPPAPGGERAPSPAAASELRAPSPAAASELRGRGGSRFPRPGPAAGERPVPRDDAARPADAPVPSPGAPAAGARELDQPEPRRAAPAPALDVERFLRVEQLRPRAVSDTGTMRIQLSSDGLGPVEVRVVVRADAVEAALWAQHDHAREALQSHRPALEAALGRANLRLEGFTVGLGGHRHGAGEDSAGGAERGVLGRLGAAVPAAGVRQDPITSLGSGLDPGPWHSLSLRA